MRRWRVSRVWCEELYLSMEEHNQSGYYFQSDLSLSKLFLDKLDLWYKHSKFRTPESSNFSKVLVARIVEKIFNRSKPSLLLKLEQVKIAETANDTSDRVGLLVAYDDLSTTLDTMVEPGDYLVIWNCFEKGFKGLSIHGNYQIELNHPLSSEVSELLVYRHNREFKFPMENDRPVENPEEFPDCKVVYSRELLPTAVEVYAQQVFSQEVAYSSCRHLTVNGQSPEENMIVVDLTDQDQLPESPLPYPVATAPPSPETRLQFQAPSSAPSSAPFEAFSNPESLTDVFDSSSGFSQRIASLASSIPATSPVKLEQRNSSTASTAGSTVILKGDEVEVEVVSSRVRTNETASSQLVFDEGGFTQEVNDDEL